MSADSVTSAEPPGSDNLVHPVHFICPEDRIWPELRSDPTRRLTQDEIALRCIGPLDCWVIRSYYELLQAGHDVTISGRLRADAINVAENYQFGRKQRSVRPFVAIARADGHDPQLANFTILQNGVCGSEKPHCTIPHWRQAGIKQRDAARENRIERITFKGASVNLAEQFRTPDFRQSLAETGVELDVGGERSDGQFWADYRHSDLVLAVRNMTEYDSFIKPASKLVNAWWAELPALLGPEPGFREMRQSELDYFEVRGPEDVISVIGKLRDTPDLYRQMVENGRKRRQEYSDRAFAGKWVEALNGPIAREFERWTGRNLLFKAHWVLKMILQEPHTKSAHRDRVLNGPRLLDD